MNNAANREGAKLHFWRYDDKSFCFGFDMANSVAIELSADEVFATGGINGADQIGFDNPLKGTLKISTQIIPLELMALACTPNGLTSGGEGTKQEVLTAAEGGTVTLTNTPVTGSVYAFKGEEASGTPATIEVAEKVVTITGAQAGDKYTVIYLMASETKKSITFSNRVSPGYYIVYGSTSWKNKKGVVCGEDFKCHKAKPQKALSITYQGTGDPTSMDITLTLLEDDNGDVYTPSREGEPAIN